MICNIKFSLLIFTFCSTLLAFGQNTRVEKDEYGEMKIPSSASYGLNVARAMKHLNISNETVSDYPDFVKALAFAKMAAIEVNSDNGALDQEKAMILNRACLSIINGGHVDAFQFELYNGSQGYLANAAMNEVLANLAIEMTGANKGDYKVVDPTDDINLNQNYISVYQTALNLTIVSQNESMLNELEALEKALNTFSAQTPSLSNENTKTPVAIQSVASGFAKQKDSLKDHIANLQMMVAHLKFHTENGASSIENLGETDFSKQISNALLTATGMNFSFQNPISQLENHLEYYTNYTKALNDMNVFLITTCKYIQALDARDSADDPFSFSNVNRDNGGHDWGHMVPTMVVENCTLIKGRLTAVQQSVESKRKKSVNDVNYMALELMVSQQQLTRSIKSLRKNYFD